ncbi:MAG: PD-(D/E)XK nuclease family protein, partial [Phycisphaerales bacterium]|nr:PD-(D/E)XK nuclease family protein [Phycisphaerales bacterium]
LELLGKLHPEEDARDPWLDPALASIQASASEVADIPVNLQPVLSAADGMDLFLAGISQAEVRLDSGSRGIEVIGWLEAPFDHAPHVVVAGFNDGAVPQSRGVDALLPETLRNMEELALPCEAGRTARDAWVMSTIRNRRPHYLVARRDGRGEGLVPSRLLLHETEEDLARKVLALFDDKAPRIHPGRDATVFSQPKAPIGEDAPEPPFNRIRVTAFRDYLRCPHGFWLRHILRLQPPDRLGSEFDARGFGNILHKVVEEYGRIDGADAIEDPVRIETLLHEQLEEQLRSLAGQAPQLGMRIQRRILQHRLSAVARKQAIENAAGWRWQRRFIEYSMEKLLDIPGQEPILVTGMVDRIEQHPDEGWRILDFKTSDRGDPPDKTHHAPRSTEHWKDLQLPLYRHLLADELSAIQEGRIQTGYFLVPAVTSKVGIRMTKRVHGLQDEAIERARQIVRDVRAGRFEPGPRTPSDTDPFAMIQRVCTIGNEDAQVGDDEAGGEG